METQFKLAPTQVDFQEALDTAVSFWNSEVRYNRTFCCFVLFFCYSFQSLAVEHWSVTNGLFYWLAKVLVIVCHNGNVSLILQTFGTFVASKRASITVWNCCGQTFKELSSIHKHVARTHDTDIHQLTQSTFEVLLSQIEKEATSQQQSTEKEPVDISSWIPDTSHITGDQLHKYGSYYIRLYGTL